MGKKTTKFINDIDTVQSECRRYIDQYVRIAVVLSDLDVKQDSTTDQLKDRIKELGGGKAAATDPVVLRCQALLTKIGMEVDAAAKRRHDIKDQIYNRLVRIESRLGLFEAYVEKKARSKNPFKSKKSIPAARSYIAETKAFHKAAEKYFKSIGGLDAI